MCDFCRLDDGTNELKKHTQLFRATTAHACNLFPEIDPIDSKCSTQFVGLVSFFMAIRLQSWRHLVESFPRVIFATQRISKSHYVIRWREQSLQCDHAEGRTTTHFAYSNFHASKQWTWPLSTRQMSGKQKSRKHLAILCSIKHCVQYNWINGTVFRRIIAMSACKSNALRRSRNCRLCDRRDSANAIKMLLWYIASNFCQCPMALMLLSFGCEGRTNAFNQTKPIHAHGITMPRTLQTRNGAPHVMSNVLLTLK